MNVWVGGKIVGALAVRVLVLTGTGAGSESWMVWVSVAVGVVWCVFWFCVVGVISVKSLGL